MFVVGDDGTLAELDGSGKNIRTLHVEKQIEDVVYHPPSGGLMLVSELKGELILIDSVSGKERRRWKLNTPALLGTPPTEANQGFEGLGFRPDPSRPGGGIIYLAHQRAPAAVVGVAFDTGSGTTVDAAAVVSRWTITGYDDLTAVSYVPSIDRVVVIADSQDRLLVLGPDGTVESEVPDPRGAAGGAGVRWLRRPLDRRRQGQVRAAAARRARRVRSARAGSVAVSGRFCRRVGAGRLHREEEVEPVN